MVWFVCVCVLSACPCVCRHLCVVAIRSVCSRACASCATSVAFGVVFDEVFPIPPLVACDFGPFQTAGGAELLASGPAHSGRLCLEDFGRH